MSLVWFLIWQCAFGRLQGRDRRSLPWLPDMVDGMGTTAYSYTAFGALLSEDGPWASDTVTLSYDNGRRRSGLNLQAPNASDWVQSYGYDAAHEVGDASQ